MSDLSDLFHDLEGWEPTDIHISLIYDGLLPTVIVQYEVSVVARKMWTARGETLMDALLDILRQLDREG